MTQSLSVLDWWVIAVYLVGLMGFAVYLAQRQGSREDYYLGGNQIGAWPIAISIMATQCSTNSILGAPAFVGFAPEGGLLWLQYELAVPLAMAILILAVGPCLNLFRSVSIYSFLERRFDLQMRLMMSALFLFVRAFATAVTVYSIAIVIDLITGIGFFWAVMILGVFTVVYDIFGGIRGVVYSDVIQLVILVVVLAIVLILLLGDIGGLDAVFANASEQRKATLDFAHHGLGDGYTFSFWPMVFGGLFLYVAYYGCDQSQAQRILSSKNVKQSQISLFLNGILRFPLVALYCLIGLALAVYAQQSPVFLQQLPLHNDAPQYNLVVPLYMLTELPSGLVGLGLVALFAAAMSSLDSVINSLSATSMDDFVKRFYLQEGSSPKQELWISRAITAFWGSATLLMAFWVGDIAPTVLEAINKIGSLANGPILGVFICAFFLKRVDSFGVKIGFISGLVVNILSWIFWQELSWLWWNVSGCLVLLMVALAASKLSSIAATPLPVQGAALANRFSLKLISALMFAFFCMLMLLALMPQGHL